MLPNHQSITHLALIQLSQQEQIIFKVNNKHTEKYSNLSSRYFTLQVNNENKRLKVQSFKLEKHIKFGTSKITNIGPFIWYARKIFRKTNIFYIISYIKRTFFVCVSRGKKCQFSENFCKCTGWMIPMYNPNNKGCKYKSSIKIFLWLLWFGFYLDGKLLWATPYFPEKLFNLTSSTVSRDKTSKHWHSSLIHVSRATGGGRPSLPFFENQEKVHWFCKKCPDCVHLWVKFSCKNVVSGVSRRKNSQIFPWKTFFPGALNKMFIKVP